MMRTLPLLILLLTVTASAQEPGSCAVGSATGTLDQSGVRASFPITGGLFYGPGLSAAYLVPQDIEVSPVYAASVWIGGTVDGELRVAGSTYGQGGVNNDYFEFWPGPLDDGATLPDPTDCSAYDRIWVVSQSEVAAVEAGQAPSTDLAEWPVGLGASAVTASGAPVVPASRDQTLDLAAGERPVVFGTQAAFWVMNDVGNVHRTTGSDPLGVEVAVTAFAVESATPALNEATFYRYQITNRSPVDIDEMRVGFYADSDLGNAADDYVGVDTTRSLGYTYNADELDDGAYDTPPPALGIDVLGGTAERQPALTAFVYFVSGGANRGDPRDAAHYDRIMRGLWRDGTPLTEFGIGYSQGGVLTTFAFAGDPVTRSFWSEENTGTGRNVTGDRRMVLSSEIGTLTSGASATIDYALVYARGTDRLDSITELRAASDTIQARYGAGTLFAPATAVGPPSGPAPDIPALVSPTDDSGPLAGPVPLTWTASEEAIDYLIEISESETFDTADRRIVTGTSTLYRNEANEPFVESEVTVYWRVTARRGALTSLPTAARSFTYTLPAVVPEAFIVEVVGPDGADPCGLDATSTVGCPPPGSPLVPSMPGNVVYRSFNGTGAYVMTYGGPAGSLSSIGSFAPNDYEIRVVPPDQGNYAYYGFTSGRIIRVPFQIWDIGVATPGEDDDPSDDVRLIPILFSENGSDAAGECQFSFDGPMPFGDQEGVGRSTQRIYAQYPTDDYAAFEALAAAAVAADPDGCPTAPATEAAGAQIDLGRGRPLQREVFVQAGTTTSMADLEGTVIRYYTRDGSTPAEPDGSETESLALTAFPNPAGDRVTVRYRLTDPGAARVTVTDLLGRRVAVLADGLHAPGEHTASLDAARLAVGVYVVVVETDRQRAARLVTVAR